MDAEIKKCSKKYPVFINKNFLPAKIFADSLCLYQIYLYLNKEIISYKRYVSILKCDEENTVIEIIMEKRIHYTNKKKNLKMNAAKADKYR